MNVKWTEVKDDPVRQHRIQSIIAGSIRAYDRLYEAGLIQEKKCCRCGSDDPTLRHVAWHCDHWQNIRAPYTRAMNAYIEEVTENNPQRRHRIIDLIRKPCVYNCGVMPESQYFLD